MKMLWVGALRLLILPAIALPGLAHADEPAPTSPPPAAVPAAPVPVAPPASNPDPAALAMVLPDPQPAPVASAPAEKLAAEAGQEEPTISHIGLDGILSGGLGSFVGASMRFEARSGTTASFLARVGYIRGSVIDDESFQAGTFSVGYRGSFRDAPTSGWRAC
jgi:hypothetical protein